MKKLLIITCMMFGFIFATAAQDTPLTAEKRAANLTDQMITELRLNNFQSKEVRAINLDKVAKMMAIEKKYAGNQAKIDELCKMVCNERDFQLEKVLSTVQYSNYYEVRTDYNKSDRTFVAQATALQAGKDITANQTVSAEGATASIN
ncbi:hypothetical protein [Pontibacter harenae]|uniref:hypothetical protein n=1 Tax=Pontibacter harenae TaxID=2894083 RepID=UPI001E6357FD|nr:hypothetical protein [Pontibacter harenae]MCC9167254.1 hypothetical protein [Pontibacter harenae]